MRVRAFLCAALVLGLAAGASASAAELTVVVQDLRSARGTVHIALWNRAAGFTEPDAGKPQIVLVPLRYPAGSPTPDRAPPPN